MRRSPTASLLLRAVMCITLAASLILGPAGLGAVVASAGLCPCTSAEGAKRPLEAKTFGGETSEAPDDDCRESCQDSCQASGEDEGCPEDCERCSCCHALVALLPEPLQLNGPLSFVPCERPLVLTALLPPTPVRVFRPPRSV